MNGTKYHAKEIILVVFRSIHTQGP